MADKGLNERFAAKVGKRKIMPPNPRILMSSVDCDEYAAMLNESPANHAGVAKHLLRGVEQLAPFADFLVIASNTGHICVPAVQQR